MINKSTNMYYCLIPHIPCYWNALLDQMKNGKPNEPADKAVKRTFYTAWRDLSVYI